MAAEEPALIGIDVGTQSVRAIAFDGTGARLAAASRATPVRQLPGGGGEYDPDTLFETVAACLAEVARALGARPVAGLAVASLGESCVLIDAAGRPLAPVLAWYDRRTERDAAELEAKLGSARIFAVAGVPVDPTLTLCKLAFMRARWPETAAAHRILCIADWIAFRLSGVAATDLTLASRTLYLDIHRRCWSAELIAAAGFGAAQLAPLAPSGTALGPVRPEILASTGLAGRPVVAVGGHDHLCGACAAGITRPGLVLDSLGTAEAVLLALAAPVDDPAVAAQGFVQGASETHRALHHIGGGINASGGAIEWFRALAGGASHAALIGEGEAIAPGSRGVLFLPHLVYAPPPQPDTAARGAFVGLTAHAPRGALYRAVLEGLAMQAAGLLEAMERLTGTEAEEIRVIGGNSRNPLFMAIKASAFGRPIRVIDEPEATALGAALLGGVGAGVFRDLDAALAGLVRPTHRVEPEAGATALYDTLRQSVFAPLQARLAPVSRALAAYDSGA